MAESKIASNTTAESDEGQERRDRVLPGSVSLKEYVEVATAIDKAGFRSTSEGMRTLGLLFARLPELRALVRANRMKVRT